MCDKKILILLAGMPGSGKSVVADVGNELGYVTVSMGDLVREEAKKRRIPLTREAIMRLALRLREEEGDGAVAVRTVKRVKKVADEGAKKIIVDGVRSLAEVNVFKRLLSEFKIILLAVHSSPRTRFKRIVERGRSDDPSRWEDFVKRDEEELRMGVGNVIALADYMIVNEEIDVDEFKRKVRKLLRELG